MVQEVVEKKGKRPLVKCPFCDYTCHGKQPLGRHIHFKHPEQREREPKISIRLGTLRGLLQAVDEKLATGQLDNITGRLGRQINEQDFKLRLTLIAIACSKAERAVTLEDMLNKVISTLQLKLTPDYLKNERISRLVDLQEKLSRGVANDTDYLKELLSMKGGSSSAFFLRAVELLKGSGAAPQQTLEKMLMGVLQVKGDGGGVFEVESFQRLVSGIIEDERGHAPEGVLESPAGDSGESAQEGTPSGSPAEAS